MTSVFFEWWKGASWWVLVAVTLINCFFCLASSQEDSPHSQPIIEQALLDALPTTEELPDGITWDQPNYTPEFFDKDWAGQRKALECPYGTKDTRTEMDHYYIRADLNFLNNSIDYNSSEDFRSQKASDFSRGTSARYPDLPGGLIWEDKDVVDWEESAPYVQQYEFEILFWKSPYIDGDVEFNVILGSDCAPPTPERQVEAEAFARSECERLAKQVYDRLPGENSKYFELISVLKKYRPTLFGSALNPKLTDDIISQALSEHEVGEGGMEGATFALNRNMLFEIDEFLKKLKEPTPPWNKSLITTLEKDNWDKTMNYYYNILDRAYKYIKNCEDDGYDYEFPIPPPLGPAEWIMKYKDYLDKAEYLRDSYYLPAVSEDMYQRYKQKRSEKLGSDEAFEESIIEGQTTLDKFIPDYFNIKVSDYIKGSGWYAVRAAPEFAFMGDDNVAVEKLLLQRFENRYNIEKLKDERDKMVKYPDYYINAIIHDYDSKILLISQTCDRILAKKKTMSNVKQ